MKDDLKIKITRIGLLFPILFLVAALIVNVLLKDYIISYGILGLAILISLLQLKKTDSKL